VRDLSGVDDQWIFLKMAGGSDDPQLWDLFLARFQGPTYRVIRRTVTRHLGRVGAEELSDEFFQSFFVSLLKDKRRQLRRFRGDAGCAPKTYLCYLAGYHVLTEMRGRRALPELYKYAFESTEKEGGEVPVDTSSAPDEAAHHRQLLSAAVAGISQMSALDQEVFELMYVRQLSPQDIADRMGKSVATIRVQHHRLRKRLRAYMSEQGLGEGGDELMAPA